MLKKHLKDNHGKLSIVLAIVLGALAAVFLFCLFVYMATDIPIFKYMFGWFEELWIAIKEFFGFHQDSGQIIL